MYTSAIQLGALVEIISTGTVICVLDNLTNPTKDSKGNTEEFLKPPKFLCEDGKVYGIDEIRILPNNFYS